MVRLGQVMYLHKDAYEEYAKRHAELNKRILPQQTLTFK